MAVIQARGIIGIGVKTTSRASFPDSATRTWNRFDIEIATLTAAGNLAATSTKRNHDRLVPEISAQSETDIQTGTIDIATYTINAARPQAVDFAGPYFRAHQDIMVKAADTTINTVTDLNGRKTCTMHRPRVNVIMALSNDACSRGSQDRRNDVQRVPRLTRPVAIGWLRIR